MSGRVYSPRPDASVTACFFRQEAFFAGVSRAHPSHHDPDRRRIRPRSRILLISADELDIEAAQTWWVVKHRLKDGLQDGVDVIEVDDGEFGFAILPTRGMSILRG